MTAKPPPIPPEQRASVSDKPDIAGGQQSGRTKSGGNLDTHGNSGNIRQNLTPQRSIQDR
ncbi:MAG TPA: hypothetical protein VG166_06140 [Caulobacteraceae bacterium]|nr:hypothetical protein [Caulobacteraceae bacterium]